jgi:hypothetical protein
MSSYPIAGSTWATWASWVTVMTLTLAGCGASSSEFAAPFKPSRHRAQS